MLRLRQCLRFAGPEGSLGGPATSRASVASFKQQHTDYRDVSFWVACVKVCTETGRWVLCHMGSCKAVPGLQDLGAALAARNLQDAIGNSGSNQLFILQSADVVERQAICDNQVCEAGERSSSANGANGGIAHRICFSCAEETSQNTAMDVNEQTRNFVHLAGKLGTSQVVLTCIAVCPTCQAAAHT